jgi:hypothetical protein
MCEVCGLAVFAQVQARLVALQQKAAGMTRPVNKDLLSASVSGLGSISSSQWSSSVSFELNEKIVDDVNAEEKGVTRPGQEDRVLRGAKQT